MIVSFFNLYVILKFFFVTIIILPHYVLTVQRRSSIAKLHNLPIEAPITKVITLLTTAMMDATLPEVTNRIDKVC